MSPLMWRGQPFGSAPRRSRSSAWSTREEMPAWEKEVVEALEEGIVINPSWGPKRILHEKGRVKGIEFVRCLSVFDAEGPVPSLL